LGVFVFAYFLWRIIWFRPYGGKTLKCLTSLTVEIPIDKNFNIQELNQRKIFYKTKTFDVFVNFFSNIVKKLDMDYWVTHTGTDGYLYLLFQRRLLRLMVYFSIISLCVSIPANVTMASGSIEDWFERTTLNNKELHSSYQGWVHVALVAIFTALTIR
jgi:hypothetical protein